MRKIEILQPGILTTVQDQGRNGYQRFGMPPAGAMDLEAYLLGQYLVGNQVLEGALECTVNGPQFICHGAMVIALTGAQMLLKKNGIVMPHCSAVFCQDGDVIEVGFSKNGVRAYLAFAGGIAVPAINGSKATYIKSHLGGYQGRKLLKADLLTIGDFAANQQFWRLPQTAVPSYRQAENTIRVVLGPQSEMFTQAGLADFLSVAGYTIMPASDRMGYRLQGKAIQHKETADIISDGTAFGSVQVPADGQPIILMADRQTTGGYSKIATVVSVDLPILAQMQQGDKVIFQAISAQEGNALYKEAKLRRQTLYAACQPAVATSEVYRVAFKGRFYRVKVTVKD